MIVLATLYFPSLDPVGPLSLFAIALSLLVAFLGAQQVPSGPRRRVVAIAPLGFLLAVLASIMLLGRHPDADDHAALITYLAFGFGASLANFRCGSLGYRINGTIFAVVYGGLIVFYALARLAVFRIPADLSVIIGLVASMTLVLALVALNRKAILRHGVTRGRCVHCGYDLRGSFEFGRCPECGTAIS